jgi:putative transposase
MNMSNRIGWVEPSGTLTLVKQCELAGVSRATWYNRQTVKPACEEDLLVCRLIDEEYTRRPFYGSRRMVIFLKAFGLPVNRRRVQRLMAIMGLAGMAPGPNTSKKHPQNKIYPYLLRGMRVARPNQVWSTDITYCRLPRGFAFLVVIIDWYSRKVLAWRVSNSMDSSFCVDCLEDALHGHGKPEIFNSDQGSQFTSTAFTDVLKREGVAISMDGRGRALDNIFVERLWRSFKDEDLYLKGYSNMAELTLGLTEYFAFFNNERPHQSLKGKTPDIVYQTASGGGAMILEKYGDSVPETTDPLRSSDVSGTVEKTVKPTALACIKTGQRRPAASEIGSTA